MASKRTASTDLSDRNWDQEEAPEEAGTFKKAAHDVLQKRIIKTAKRRNPISSTNETSAKSAFGSFAGFNKTPMSSTSFSFLNTTTPKADTSTVNGVTNSPSIFTQPSSVTSSVANVSENKALHNEKEDEYYAKLKGLNESVLNWIKKHVDTNPLINLKPVFKDYEKYFEELEHLRSMAVSPSTSKLSDESSVLKKELNSFVFKPATDVKEETDKRAPQFQFTKTINAKEDNLKTSAATFSFSAGATTTAASFSFGANATTTSSSTGFNFGSPAAKPFTFTNVTQPPANSEEVNEEQDEDEPPKVEFVPVVEEGHTYTVKCKVFVKNGGSFGDRGVGTLYLKPVPDSEKTQLIVRADTSLGNLLCNFILSKGIPTKRMGKKDVMLICLPTPESKPPPVPVLLRVKSPAEADELLTTLEKHKK